MYKEKQLEIMSNSGMAMEADMAPDPRWINERYLLDVIKTQLGITDEDMKSTSIVKSKVREANIDKVLDK